MKNKLLMLVNKLLQHKQTLIDRIKNQRRSLIHTQPSRQHRLVRLLVYLSVGMIASTVMALYFAPTGLPQTAYRTSWLGNTFGGGNKWVQIQMSALYVAPDGTAYTNSAWDEAAREVGIYKNGDVIGSADDLHGWGRGGGQAITANSKYIYVGMRQEKEGKADEDYPPSGTTWYCVRRYDLSGQPAPFRGGRGWDKSMVIVSKSAPVTGLANVGNQLYVSDPGANRIRVYNSETMTQIRTWVVPRPGPIAVDRQGNLWIIQTKDASNASKILHYSQTGRQLPKQITGVGEPTAIAIDNQGRLLVADNGPQQQILIYDLKQAPVQVATLGSKGGITSGIPGEVTPEKLGGITGVGTDAAGNIYISQDGSNRSGALLSSYSPNRRLLWQLMGLQFLDTADADPGTNGLDVFTKDEHFVMDYRKSNGKEWRYKAHTLDRFRYPDDGRLHTTPTAPFVRRIQGKRFLFLSSEMLAERLLIYRFDGEIAVPCGMFTRGHTDWPANQPARGSWLWRDQNGNGSIQRNEYEILNSKNDDVLWGWEVDSKGDIWQASESGVIRHYRFQGLDSYGSPIYGAAASEVIPKPALFNTLERIKYFPETDVMYLAGYTVERPNLDGDWGLVGTEIVRYDNWSTSKNVRWRLALPYDPAAEPKAMDVAGERVFAVTSKTGEARAIEVYVYNAATGALVSKLSPGPEVSRESGWVDIPYGLRAYRRSNGEYLVFVEENSKGKVIMYRLPPTS
jgi:hypothetical protein